MTIPAIRATAFFQALHQTGVLPDITRVRRVVIDADASRLVRIHVEYIGDERLLEVARTLLP